MEIQWIFWEIHVATCFLRVLHVLIGASKNVMFTLDFDSKLQFINRLLPILIPPILRVY